MSLKQISVFLENKSGRLAEVTKVIAGANINLRAMTIADTADFGILRLIVDNVDKTLEILNKNSFTTKVTDVIAVEVEDSPGELSKILEIFEANGINIEYLYVTLEKSNNKAVVVLKVDNVDLGLEITKKNNLKLVGRL